MIETQHAPRATREGLRTEFHSCVSGRRFEGEGTTTEIIDPTTGEAWALAHTTAGAVDAAVAAADEAFSSGAWSLLPNEARAAVLRKAAAGILANTDRLARYESLATGKPIAATTAEIQYAARWYEYYASAIEVERESSLALTPLKTARITVEPAGVVAAITPFNGAFSLGSWKFAPALAAGNSIVVKPPIHSLGSTLELADILQSAGLPDGVFNVVVGDAEEGEQLVADNRAAVVAFTGSTAVGERIGAIVGGRLGRFLCEAGGKSAHIVLEDADLTSAVIAATQGVFSGAGQTCVAGSRILVDERVANRFTEAFVAHAAQLSVGDPEDEATHLGPISTAAQHARIRAMVDRAEAAGASVLLDGRDPEVAEGLAGGYWFGPTILEGVSQDAEIWRDEVFGPVAVIQRVSGLEEALEVANASEFGLAAGIWTADQARARTAARALQAGTVWINTYRGMDWRTPFGGYKKSGVGRENGLEALAEFRQIKTVIDDAAPAADPFGLPAPTLSATDVSIT